ASLPSRTIGWGPIARLPGNRVATCKAEKGCTHVTNYPTLQPGKMGHSKVYSTYALTHQEGRSLISKRHGGFLQHQNNYMLTIMGQGHSLGFLCAECPRAGTSGSPGAARFVLQLG